MTEKFAPTTWGFIEVRDFVRIDDVTYRVDRTASDGDRLAVEVFNPRHGRHSGKRRPTTAVYVRIEHNGKRTAAGRRDDGLTTEGEAALKALLDAELLAIQDLGGEKLQPYVFPERFADVLALASHLKMFHELFADGAKAKDGAELRAIHREFHAADPKTQRHSARRVPHIHNDEAFGGLK